MTEVEWRNEAKTLRDILLRHKEVVERFAGQVLKYVPGLPPRIEAEELFDRIQEGIEELSRKKDSLAAENKDLPLAIAKKSHDKHNTEDFSAAVMHCFPHLQKKYEVCKDPFTFYYEWALSVLDTVSMISFIRHNVETISCAASKLA